MKKFVLVTLAAMLCLTGCKANIKDGVALLEAGKYKEAKEYFQTDIKEDKNLDEAFHGMGIASFELGEYEDALVYFDAALQNGVEESAIICSLMAACCMEEEEYEKALDMYEKALAKEDITAEQKQEIEKNLIGLYEKMENWDAAKKQMDKYVKAYPDDTSVEKEAEFLESR